MLGAYNTTYYVSSSDVATVVGIGLTTYIIFAILSLAVTIFMIVSMWKLFKKAGKEGWASIIPIYNTIVMIQIAELPLWYIALLLVPLVNIYAVFKIFIEMAKKFGKSTGFGVAMVFFSIICIPILAFSKDVVYKGSNNAANAAAPNMDPSQNYYGGQQPMQPQQPIQPAAPVQPQDPTMPQGPTTPTSF